jgi:hypothetical protein
VACATRSGASSKHACESDHEIQCHVSVADLGVREPINERVGYLALRFLEIERREDFRMVSERGRDEVPEGAPIPEDDG